MRNRKKIFKKIKEFKSYIVEFETYSTMKPKAYLFNYIIRKDNLQPIIVITYNKYIVSVNNKVQRA